MLLNVQNCSKRKNPVRQTDIMIVNVESVSKQRNNTNVKLSFKMYAIAKTLLEVLTWYFYTLLLFVERNNYCWKAGKQEEYKTGPLLPSERRREVVSKELCLQEAKQELHVLSSSFLER